MNTKERTHSNNMKYRKLSDKMTCEVVTYAAHEILHNIFIAICCFLIGGSMEMLYESLVFLLSFCVIRRYTGGIHSETRIKCFFATTTLFYINLLAIQLMPYKWTAIAAIPFASIILRHAPFEYNVAYTLRQKIGMRQQLRRTLFILFVLVWASLIFTAPTFYASINFAVISVGVLAICITNPHFSLQKRSHRVTNRMLATITSIFFSIGITMIQGNCEWFMYQPEISVSLRKYVDNL